MENPTVILWFTKMYLILCVEYLVSSILKCNLNTIYIYIIPLKNSKSSRDRYPVHHFQSILRTFSKFLIRYWTDNIGNLKEETQTKFWQKGFSRLRNIIIIKTVKLLNDNIICFKGKMYNLFYLRISSWSDSFSYTFYNRLFIFYNNIIIYMYM